MALYTLEAASPLIEASEAFRTIALPAGIKLRVHIDAFLLNRFSDSKDEKAALAEAMRTSQVEEGV